MRFSMPWVSALKRFRLRQKKFYGHSTNKRRIISRDQKHILIPSLARREEACPEQSRRGKGEGKNPRALPSPLSSPSYGGRGSIAQPVGSWEFLIEKSQ